MSRTQKAESGGSRLAGPGWGLLVDPDRPISFTFDGTPQEGLDGDTIASALMASGRSLLSRSFKYHRPRGALTMAGHDVNAMVQVGAEPNVRGDRHLIEEGMAVTSINRLGSLDADRYAAIGLFSRFLPVGFYYKTFFRPSGAWKYFEKPIRELAGLGKLDPKAPHGHYDKRYLFCDVLVVGGGPAGLEAAIASAEAGAETILMDEWPALGGSLLFGRAGGARADADARRASLAAKALASPGLTVMTDTTVTGLFSDGWASAISASRLYKVRAAQTVLATGSFDQPLVFRNNDLPGIMFADAAQRLMRLYGVKPGRRAVVVTANRFGYEAALDLAEAGVDVAGIVDLNLACSGKAPQEASARGIRILPAATLVEARGRRHVEAVAVARLVGRGKAASSLEWIDCDLVAMSVGFTPSLNLASHAGAKIVYDEATSMHRATDLPAGLTVAGSTAGLWSEAAVSAQARRAGRSAAGSALGMSGEAEAGEATLADVTADAEASLVTHPWPIFTHPKSGDFIDFDEDLKTDDILNTIADGYDDIQLVKRYSTVGLGPSQGRHANLNTIRLVADATGKSIGSVGTTTFRPPLVPEKFAHLAGRSFEPVRHTAMHHRHVELGARMMVAGAWLRPAYYGAKGASAAAIEGEVRSVREGVGMIDVSTLGGLDVRGPDAAELIDRMYTWAYAKQPVGRARYALMTDQTGVVIDDGVACRFHERHFYVTATTGAVDQVYRQMTWWNSQWKLDVDVANVTAAFAGVNIAGPRAREVVRGLESDIDFSAEAFPYMAVRLGRLGGIPVRVLRVGFVGELGYEIHCPSSMGEALWDMLAEAGRPFGLTPFGVEAQRVLRLEKGHIIVGQDTDGLTNPAEAGMEWALAKKKPFYIGKRAVDIQIAKGIGRRLVGFALADIAAPCPKECHLVIRGGAIAGRVTSAVRSPSLGKVVGLAYVPDDLSAAGSRFEIRVDGGRMVSAEVVPTPFYDPDNKRQEL
jgi:sarcosine oxidase subunit alpha